MSLAHARVVVIGGGVVGCSVLYHLAKAGWRDLVLLEKAELTSGSTWHAAANGNTFSGSATMSWAMKRTFELWDSLEAESGQALSAHRVGGLLVARTPERLDDIKSMKGLGRRLGIGYELLGPEEVKRHWPLLDCRTVVAALYDPNGGHVDPYGLTHAYARLARAKGATIKRQCAVTGLAQKPDGTWRVGTTEGEINAEIIVNAAGFYAGEIARMTAAALPMIAMQHQYLITEAISEIDALDREQPVLRDFDLSAYVRQEGRGLLIGIYEQDCREFGAEGMPPDFAQQLLPGDLDRVMPEMGRLCEAIPALQRVGIKTIVNGPFCFSPDVIPLLGWMPKQRNHFCAAGFLGGVSGSGGFGELIAEWIVDGQPSRDLTACDVARYGDWALGGYATARGHDCYRYRAGVHFPNENRPAGRPARKPPLYDRFVAAKGVFAPADGWERPLYLAGPGEPAREVETFRRSNAFAATARECKAVMGGVGYQDLIAYSHFEVAGRDAARFLDRLLTNTLPAAGRLKLTTMTNRVGGTIGDFIVLCLSDQHYRLFGSGALHRIHARWFDEHAQGLELSIVDLTDEWSGFMLAGPKARELMARVSNDDVSQAGMPFFTGRRMTIAGAPCIVNRLSFSGELTFELHCRHDDQCALHDALTSAGADCGLAPFGSYAVNSMRVEKGFPRMGNELNPEITPFEAGLRRLVKLDKPDFVGREALIAAAEAGPRYRLACLEVDAGDADAVGGEAIVLNERCVGWVSSGAYGHRSGKSLALAYVGPQLCAAGQVLDVQILDEPRRATVLAGPAYDPDGSRARA